MDTTKLRELAMAAKGDDPERVWPFKTQAYIRAAGPATILALLDRLEAAETKLRHATMAADAEASIVDELKAKLEAAEKDKARYRWLRDSASSATVTAPLCWHTDATGQPHTAAVGADLDAAIDAARGEG